MLSSRDMKISTTDSIFGHTITAHKGVVFDRVVVGAGMVTEFFAGLTDIFGGRSGKMEDQMDALYDNLLRSLSNKAKEIGANAIVGFHIDIDEISGKGTMMLMISGTGTAVVVQPLLSEACLKPTSKVDTEWECVKCKTIHTWKDNYCPICGERRHFDWQCGACGTENISKHNFCPVCGKAREEHEERVIDYSASITNKESLYEALDSKQTAREIYDYLQNQFADNPDTEISNFLKILSKISGIERMYGNSKNTAMRCVKGFFDHDMQVFHVDRTGQTVQCPACGSSQKAVQNYCSNCNALFMG